MFLFDWGTIFLIFLHIHSYWVSISEPKFFFSQNYVIYTFRIKPGHYLLMLNWHLLTFSLATKSRNQSFFKCP